MTEPYNPLSKFNLARSIEGEILARPLVTFADLGSFEGAGIYALYYAGEFEPYRSLKASLSTASPRPIYVGKAIPEGGRTGGLRKDGFKTRALSKRLGKHSGSIASADNLSVNDFLVRYLIVDDVWIPLGENMLIESYQPVWNKVVAGFGNNTLGIGRKDQKVSLWDILHPGRISGVDLSLQKTTQSELVDRIERYFAGEAVPQVDERESEVDDT